MLQQTLPSRFFYTVICSWLFPFDEGMHGKKVETMVWYFMQHLYSLHLPSILFFHELRHSFGISPPTGKYGATCAHSPRSTDYKRHFSRLGPEFLH